MTIGFDRIGGGRPVEMTPAGAVAPSDGAPQGAAPSRPENLKVTEAPAGLAETASAAVEADLTRTDDIGQIFAKYGYPAPKMPEFV